MDFSYFTTITIDILKAISHFTGSYGWAIVALTLFIRLVMWPLGVSQQRSMKKMQELGPKMKLIQDKYKSDPQVMQKKMMEFYKENKFNPFGGCLPTLLQMPLFILLYAALSNPLFILASGEHSFLFINKLHSTLMSHSGVVGDGAFDIKPKDRFSIYNKVTVYTQKGVIKDVKLNDDIKGHILASNEIVIDSKKHKDNNSTKLVAGDPLQVKVSLDKLDLDVNQLKDVTKADIIVVNDTSREVEKLSFNKENSDLVAKIPTKLGKDAMHYDVLILVILFAVSMWVSQKAMTGSNKNTSVDPAQQAMQDQMSKMMPIMVTSMFIFMPIPAGVLLYMVISSFFQGLQTVFINKQIDAEASAAPKVNKMSSGKSVEVKETKKEEVIIDCNESTND